ncbi:MAG: fluoride efflux transporter CrcB [Hyphomicrobiaceae bacterium]|nr:fluoride efflux transporter CrcB [Hyphomicrobiaceae bacterium]
MKMLLLASAGGAIGAGARHLVNLGMGRLLGTAFPWGTLTVNILGSFLMGVLVELLVLRFGGSPTMRTLLGTGFLGGFTTFSAFSLDVLVLLERRETGLALVYVAGSVLVGFAALYAGVVLVRMVLS